MSFSESEIINKIKIAKNALLKNQNEKAERILDEIMEEDLANEHMWLLTGIIKRRLNKYTQAIKCFQTAIDLNQELEEAWGLLTITFLDINKKKRAQDVLDKAINLNPSNNKLKFFQENLIHVYDRFGSFFDKLDNL